jgi:SAM-dependent methyltransferase
MPSASDDDLAWQHFTAWLPSAAPAGHIRGVFDQYSAYLGEGGMDPETADRRLDAVQRLMRVHREAWPLVFDCVYASDTPGFNTQPNALLVETVRGLAPGDALEIGVGQGRNSVFLARHGWRVTGFDVSEEGLNATRRNAEAAGVSVATLHNADGVLDPGASAWDLIVLTYVPVPVTDRRYVEGLARALRPGGLVVVESFASPEGTAGRTPVDIDPDALQRAFSGWETVRLGSAVGAADWSPRPVPVVRFVARSGGS